METSAVTVVPFGDVLGTLDSREPAQEYRRRGVGDYQARVTDARDAMTVALAHANELRVIPEDQRREVAELASRLTILAGEVGRLG